MKDKILRLHGQVQHYAWGGFEFLPQLLGFDNAQHKPCAEYWMGVHTGGPGKVETHHGLRQWSQLIAENPEAYLGSDVYHRFGELPYLLKILDVREMLSIQVHPSKEEAAKSFDAEEAAGIPINAPNRNYKDRNHKPEVMIALSEFWLLHGFQQPAAMQAVLSTVPEFASLAAIFEAQGYKGLYSHIMHLPQADVDTMLLPLVQRELAAPPAKNQPGYWVNKLYKGVVPDSNIDRGIFSIYFFNIVRVQPGQGVFQDAGVPHAYLEGQNVELMANSDNVLRGGLTPKHIDVEELLKHTRFEGITPHVQSPEDSFKGEKEFSVPVDDFGICALHLSTGREYVNESTSPETFIVLSGEVYCHHLNCKKGESFIVLPGVSYTIRAVEDAVLYKAYVPVR